MDRKTTFEKDSIQRQFFGDLYRFCETYYEREDTDEYYDTLDKDFQHLWDKYRKAGDQRFMFFVLNMLKGFSEYVVMDNRSKRIPKELEGKGDDDGK